MLKREDKGCASDEAPSFKRRGQTRSGPEALLGFMLEIASLTSCGEIKMRSREFRDRLSRSGGSLLLSLIVDCCVKYVFNRFAFW